MSPVWSRPTRYVVAIALMLFGIFVLYLSRPVLPLLALSAVLSFALLPIVNLLHHRYGMGRGAAVLVTYLVGVLGLVLALLFVVPAIINAVQFAVSLDYGAVVATASRSARGWLERVEAAEIPFGPLERLIDDAAATLLASLSGAAPAAPGEEAGDSGALVQQIGSLLTGSFNLISGVVGEVLSQLLTGIFVVLFSLYISMDAHKLKGRFLSGFPADHRNEVAVLVSRIQRVWNGFLRGQLSLMAFIGVFVWLGLSLLGLPYALVLGIVAGLLEFVPNLGPIIATVPAVLIALLEGSSVLDISPPMFALVIVLFYVIVQQIENNVVVPRLLGDAVNLPPVVVMSGVLVGASVGGVLGALLATPLIATAREIVSYLYRKVTNSEPFPAEENQPAPGAEPWKQQARQWAARLRARFEPAPPRADEPRGEE